MTQAVRHQSMHQETVGSVDQWLLISTGLLLVFGFIMVASASMIISDKLFHDPFHYMIRQGVYLLVGVLAMFAVSRISLAWWQRFSLGLFMLSVLLLVLVLIPGIGHVVNGSRRWIHLPFMSIQLSEFVKLSVVMFLADYATRRSLELRTKWSAFLKPLILVCVLIVLLLAEPDFGTSTILIAITLSVLFVAEAPLKPFALLVLAVLVVFVALALLSPYRLLRVLSFMHPWKTPYGSGYQLTQSLIAFGRGGVFGVGLGNGLQKLLYLPEAHTDFLYAVIAEEFGLVGSSVVLLLFGTLVWRACWWGRQALMAGKRFAGLVAYGIAFWIAFQVAINCGVTLGLLPTKGLTLPFMSYGGTSLLVSCMSVGVLLRIAAEVGSVSQRGYKNEY